MRPRLIVRIVLVALCLLICAGALGVNSRLAKSLPSQRAYERWSTEEMPCGQYTLFINKDSNFGEHDALGLHYGMANALEKESIQSTNRDSRSFVDCYSGECSMTASNGNESVSVRAVLTGGDFFTFHPLNMRSGWYYSSLDTMDDGVILDRDAAWKLFGGYDLVGMTVRINGYPCVISGVAERPDEKNEDECYGKTPTVYLPYSLRERAGVEAPITCYEVILPNGVKGFGEKLFRENIPLSEEQYEYAVNSDRFKLVSGFKVAARFAERVQRTGGIYFPWWENAARYLESVSSLLVLLAAASLIYPLVIAFVYVGKGIKRRRVLFDAVKKITEKININSGSSGKWRKRHEKDY